MKFYLFLHFLLGSMLCSYAHETSVTYFLVEQQPTAIKVSVDLPWTIKDALEQHDPQLKVHKNKTYFQKVLQSYVTKHLLLWSVDSTKIPLRTIREATPAKGHAHGAYFEFLFENGEIAKIENTFLFEINRKQRNLHSLRTHESKNEFATTPRSPSYVIASNTSCTQAAIPIGLLVLLSSSGITYLFLKKLKK